MDGRLRRRFWVEAAVGLGSALLCLVTLVWHDWIEIVFALDPDQGSGALEWLIVAVTLAIAVTAIALARQEWRRPVATAT